MIESYWLLVLPTGLVALLAVPPSMMLLAAACALDLSAGARVAHAAAAARLPPVARALEALGAQALPRLANVPAAEAASWPVSRRWEVARATLVRWAARADAYAALAAAAGLVLPSRALVATMVLWQLQQFKYSLSGPHREAWAAIDAAIAGVLAHRAVPAALLRAYAALAAMLRRQVRSPEDLAAEAARASRTPSPAAAAGGGMLGGLQGIASRARQACAVQ